VRNLWIGGDNGFSGDQVSEPDSGNGRFDVDGELCSLSSMGGRLLCSMGLSPVGGWRFGGAERLPLASLNNGLLSRTGDGELVRSIKSLVSASPVTYCRSGPGINI